MIRFLLSVFFKGDRGNRALGLILIIMLQNNQIPQHMPLFIIHLRKIVPVKNTRIVLDVINAIGHSRRA